MTNQFLKNLSITQQEQTRKLDPFAKAKAKLIVNLKQQMNAAEAMVKGEAYTVSKMITVDQDGQKVRKQVNKPIRAWYWRDGNGDIRFRVRVANKAVELEKGKTDIVVGGDKDLPGVVQTVLKAVEAGELDRLIKTMTDKKTATS